MKTFHLTIARIGENLFDGEALSVTLPGTEGAFTVLAGHEAFVSPLKEGVARVRTEGADDLVIPIASGVAEVSGSQATVLL